MEQGKRFLAQLAQFVPRKTVLIGGALLGVSLMAGLGFAVGERLMARAQGTAAPQDGQVDSNASQMVSQGRQVFRFDTFGDQAFWGDTLQLHKAIEGQQNGGTGPGVSPRTALAVGLKVDSSALTPGDVAFVVANFDDPKGTLRLLQKNAVVGVTGFFNPDGTLKSMGIQCAFCHSTVDNSFQPGIGQRLDAWPNRDLNVGAIVDLSPNLQPVATFLGVDVATLHTVLQSWGPGKFDAEVFLDRKAFRPDGTSGATLIPPAFGLAGNALHTWTGWGQVTYWNAFVANLEMHGIGIFFDERLDNANQFPVAAQHNLGHTAVPLQNDQITAKLAALHFYQLAIAAPAPPAGTFNPALARLGQALFVGKAKCATCHVPPLYTEPGWNLHTPQEIGIDDFQSNRSATTTFDPRTGSLSAHGYRTSPLNGLWTHVCGASTTSRANGGGFFHDGRFATLNDVVAHYNTFFNLGLTPGEQKQLVEFLKSLPNTGQAPVPGTTCTEQTATSTTSSSPIAAVTQLAQTGLGPQGPAAGLLLGIVFVMAAFAAVARRRLVR